MDNPNPIFYRDLITPDDSIQALIQQLTELISKYEEMRGKIQSNAADLAKSMQGVSGATDEQREAITQSAREADALAEAMKRVREAEGAARTEVNSLKDAQREMNQLTKLQGELARSAEGSYKQLSAQYRINKIALNNMSKAQREGTEAGRKLEQETKAIYEEMNRLQKATGKYTLQVGNYELALGKATGVNVGFVQTLLDGNKASETFHGIMGALTGPIGLVAGAVGLATGAIKLFASSIHDTQSTGDAFDLAMSEWNASWAVFKKSVSTVDFTGFIIGAREAAVAGRELAMALDEAFERRGSIRIQRARAQEENEVLLERLRNRKLSLAEREKAGRDYLKNMEPIYQQETELAKELEEDELEYLFSVTNRTKYRSKEERNAAKERLGQYIQDYNLNRGRIKQAEAYNKAVDDLATAEKAYRKASGAAAKAYQEQIQRNREAIAQTSDEVKEYAGVVRQYGLTSDTEVERYQNAVVARIDASNAFSRENRRITTQINSLDAQNTKETVTNAGARNKARKTEADEAEESAKKQIDALQKIADEEEKVRQEQYKRLKSARMERLKFEREEINLRIEAGDESLDTRIELINKERDIALEANRQLAEDLRQNEALINAKYDKKVLDEIDRRAENVKKRTQKAVTNTRKEYGNLFQVFGINLGTKDEADEVLRERETALISAIDNIKDSVSSLIDSWREAGKAAIEAADAQVDAAQKVVDSEREAAANGYANSVQRAERELALAKKQREEAQKEAERAHRAQILLDTAAQTSSLITASANIWKSLSGIPVVGPGLAVAALASMWASFAASRVKAFQVTKETYGEGTVELLQGGSHASGHDIPLGYTKDGKERRAEGGEFFAVINKRNSRRFRDVIPDVINSLNDGSFAERYQRAGQQLKGVAIQMMTPNLGRLEADVDAIRKQGEERRSIEGGVTIIRYKNLIRRIKS